VYVNSPLPFKLRSAPLLFTALRDATQWSVEHAGVEWLGLYIDDFFTVGRPNTGECGKNLGDLKDMSTEWGLPVNDGKEDGPAAVNTFFEVRGGHGGRGVKVNQGKIGCNDDPGKGVVAHKIMLQEGFSVHHGVPQPRM